MCIDAFLKAIFFRRKKEENGEKYVTLKCLFSYSNLSPYYI